MRSLEYVNQTILNCKSSASISDENVKTYRTIEIDEKTNIWLIISRSSVYVCNIS